MLFVFFSSCTESLNEYIEESDETFNPELTVLYNQIIKKPDSENRILGMTHYSLTSQTIEFLDSIKIEIKNLNCTVDENCVIEYLNRTLKGVMLKGYLTISRNNNYAMCTDSTTKLYLDKNLTEFENLKKNDRWLDSTFMRKSPLEALKLIEHYRNSINNTSIPIMKELLSKS